MKASELMIGDWVKQSNLGYNFKVDEIFTSDVMHTNNVGTRIQEDIREIEPIPLTEEVLKANGFCVSDEHATIYDGDDEGLFSISITKTGMWLPISFYGKGLRLVYVHELQRALRLCGLNEIADNFKVE